MRSIVLSTVTAFTLSAASAAAVTVSPDASGGLRVAPTGIDQVTAGCVAAPCPAAIIARDGNPVALVGHGYPFSAAALEGAPLAMPTDESAIATAGFTPGVAQALAPVPLMVPLLLGALGMMAYMGRRRV
ncbi:MAG: hypothetical protein AAF677_01055 [Pseudomonadota bacterium]